MIKVEGMEFIVVPPNEYGQIEEYVVGFSGGENDNQGLFDYATLPEILTSNRLESAGAELVELTRQFVSGDEYGRWHHIQRDTSELLIPKNATRGKKVTVYSSDFGGGTTNYSVTPDFVATANVSRQVFDHSHPGVGAHSFTDIWLSLGKEQPVRPILNYARTRQHHYMLARTAQSLDLSQEELVDIYVEAESKASVAAEEIGNREDDLIANDETGDKLNIIMDDFDGSVWKYYKDLATIQEVADVTKLGFYYSKRDGIYHKLSYAAIDLMVNELFNSVDHRI